MAKGLFINYFETLGLDPADGRSKNYEILTERFNKSTGQLSQEAKYQAGILSRAMEAFKDQENYEDFLKEIEESQQRQQERAARDRAQQERERAQRDQAERQRAERQRAERQQAERQRTEREQAEQQRTEREQAERQRTEPERGERQRPDQERAAREPVRSPRRRRIVLISAVAVLVAVGATVGGLVLFNKQPSQQAVGLGDVAVSPDGKFIAADDNSVYPGRIYIWNTATKRLAATLTGPLIQDDGLDYLAFTPDSKTIIAQSGDDPITIWDIATRRLIATISDPRTDDDSCVALSPDGKMLAACGGSNSTGIDDNVYLIDIAHRSISATLHLTSDNACQSGINVAAFSPDGKVLAVSALPCNSDARVQLWDINTRRIITTMPFEYPLIYSHDGSMLLVGDNLVYMRQDSSIPESTRKLPNGINVSLAAFSPDDKTLAISEYSNGHPNGSVVLLKLATNQEIATLTDPNSTGITSLAYTPDGKTLVTADGNGSIYLWDIATGSIYATLTNSSS